MAERDYGPMSETVEVETIFGRIEAFPRDLITNQLVAYGAHTRPELALLLSVIHPGDFVFDVGAHIGTFTIPIAKKIGPSGRLLAVEGVHDHLVLLRRNVARHELQDTVTIVDAIIGSPVERYSVRTEPGNSEGALFIASQSSDGCAGTNLDDLLAATFVPRVVKLDIEGHEGVALRDAHALLAARPIIYAEIVERLLQDNGSSTKELGELLRGAGYRFFRNIGDRNAAHDHFLVTESFRLESGSRSQFDVLAIHREDPRIEAVIALAHPDTPFKLFFDQMIGDLPTHEYLTQPKLVSRLDNLISFHFDADTAAIRSLLLRGAPPGSPNAALRVALSNVALENFAGSELWTADIARFLRDSGVPLIVYSPGTDGPVSDMLRRQGIAVTSSIADVEAFDPSIVHVNHFQAVADLVDRLKGHATIVNMVHGLLPRAGLPGYGNVDRYCCVSVHARAKIHVLTNAPWNEIGQLPNFFDERRFTRISHPGRMKRAALLSSRTPPERREQLRSFLEPLGFTLDHFGYGGTLTSEPEKVLPDYDIVFAVGRSAIEGLASGAHVILWDFGIIGPAVTPENFWQCVDSNFDLASNMLHWTFIEHSGAGDWIREQILRISDGIRIETTKLARTYLPLSAAGARLLQFYGGLPHREDRR